MNDLSQYGPWAIAFGLLLLTLKEVVLQAINKNKVIDSNAAVTPPALLELAHAVEKLTNVLDRMERFQDRSLTDLMTGQRDMLRMLTELKARGGSPDGKT